MTGREGILEVGRWRGVTVRLHPSVLLALPFFAFYCAGHLRAAPETLVTAKTTLSPVAWGVVLAASLVVSLLGGELARIWTARAFGGRVRGITLVLLGGDLDAECLRKWPLAQAAVSAAGPLASLGIAALFVNLAGCAWLFCGWDVRAALRCHAEAHLLLAGVNLLPSYPLAGGRMLHACLQRSMGDEGALQMCARVARVLAITFGILGAIQSSPIMLGLAILLWSRAADGAPRTDSGTLRPWPTSVPSLS